MNLACVILAAGMGKRMKSGVPKVLHPVCGIPMLRHVIRAVRKLSSEKTIIVTGRSDNIQKAVAEKGIFFAVQEKPLGTADALRAARRHLKGFKGTVVVLNGDTPLIRHTTVKRFIQLHHRNRNSISVLSFFASDPYGYGRIVRDGRGRMCAITEQKDADQEVQKISEVSSGVYAISHDALSLLDRIRVNRAKGEFYLTDIVALALGDGLKAAAYPIGGEGEFMGVNTREELFRASLLLREDIVRAWMSRGVNFLDPGSVFIHPDVSVGRETIMYPNVHLEGNTRIGRASVIYPNVRIIDSTVGDGVTIKDSTVIEGSIVKNHASVGPFAHLRPGSEVGPDARIGNFVELKKAVIGKGTKASHLSYLGDTVIGSGVNIGAGTITCNYDGLNKHSTIIEDDVFVGSDTQFVAPVKIGRRAYIGAGSTITRDVPADALALTRSQQRHFDGWASRRKLKVNSKKLKVKNKKKQ